MEFFHFNIIDFVMRMIYDLVVVGKVYIEILSVMIDMFHKCCNSRELDGVN